MTLLNLKNGNLKKVVPLFAFNCNNFLREDEIQPGLLLFIRRLPSQVLFCFVVHQIPHKICSHGPKSSFPLVIATTTSRPIIWRFRCASALSSPVSLCLYCSVGLCGANFSSQVSKSPCKPLSLLFINTLAVICIAFTFTKHRPSLILLS